MSWTVTFLNEDVAAELQAMPLDIRASFERIVRLIQAHGLERVHEPYIKHLEGRLWEMRLRGKDGIARAIYVTASGQRMVVLRAFSKKSQRTPRRELDLAAKRAKEVT
jgi:phage-related protein